MSKTKMFIKKFLISSCVLLTVSSLLAFGLIKLSVWIDNLVPTYIVPTAKVARAEREFNYLDKVPVEIVKEEIRKQARELKLDERFMLNLADCESDFGNWKKNPKSTAKGVYQWIASSWDATTSGKARVSPYDYRANIREAMIKIANNEFSHWAECLK